MSKYVRKSHNVSVLLYHIVCPAKYRRKIFTKEVTNDLVEICKEISDRYEIYFIEIGTDEDHVHFLVQSVPTYSPQQLVQRIKSLTAIEMFKRRPELKKELWGSKFWTSGYFINTVGASGNEDTIAKYVQSQGGKKSDYKKIHGSQLRLELF